MKYPRIDKKELNSLNKVKFEQLLQVITESIEFDKQENELRISAKDVELLAWNSATCCIAMIMTAEKNQVTAFTDSLVGKKAIKGELTT